MLPQARTSLRHSTELALDVLHRTGRRGSDAPAVSSAVNAT
jgi:hypothetical protein